MRTHLSSLLVVGLLACTAARTNVSEPEAHAAAPSEAHASALPFIEDDYPRALAEARRKGVPLFVDTWASW